MVSEIKNAVYIPITTTAATGTPMQMNLIISNALVIVMFFTSWANSKALFFLVNGLREYVPTCLAMYPTLRNFPCSRCQHRYSF